MYIFLLNLVLAFSITYLALEKHTFLTFLGSDDANIFFRYANNFLQDGAFAWNLGAERVEGFTSLLWMIISSLLAALPVNLHFALLGLNVLILATTATYCLKFIKTNPISYAFFIAAFYSTTGYVVWSSISLLESGLWALLLTMLIATALFKNNSKLYTPLKLALILTRPEGMLFIFCADAIVFLKNKAWLQFIYSGVLIAGLSLFRQLYFGYPLPNTYYAKVGGNLTNNLELGLEYFKNWTLTSPSMLILLASGAVLILLHKNFQNRKNLFMLAAFIIIFISTYIYLGGDHFAYQRLLQAIVPLVLLATTLILANLIDTKKHTWAICLVLITIAAQIYNFNQPVEVKKFRTEFVIAYDGYEKGKLLNKYFATNHPQVAALTVGGFGYSYEGPVYDLLALNNSKMAHFNSERSGPSGHSAFQKEVFLEDKPELLSFFIFPCPTAADFHPEIFQAMLKGILDDADFLKLYRLTYLENTFPDIDTPGICGFIRKDYYQKVKSQIPFKIF